MSISRQTGRPVCTSATHNTNNNTSWFFALLWCNRFAIGRRDVHSQRRQPKMDHVVPGFRETLPREAIGVGRKNVLRLEIVMRAHRRVHKSEHGARHAVHIQSESSREVSY